MDAGITILRQNGMSWSVTCCLFGGAFGGLPLAVPAAPGVQELDPVDVDEIPVVLGTRLFVVPRLRALPAFEINAGAFVKVFAGDLCHGDRRLSRQTTPCVLAVRRPCPSIVPWSRRRTARWPFPVGCTSPQDHGRDFRSTLLSAWVYSSSICKSVCDTGEEGPVAPPNYAECVTQLA